GLDPLGEGRGGRTLGTAPDAQHGDKEHSGGLRDTRHGGTPGTDSRGLAAGVTFDPTSPKCRREKRSAGGRRWALAGGAARSSPTCLEPPHVTFSFGGSVGGTLRDLTAPRRIRRRWTFTSRQSRMCL